jgi:hypothetical protein
MIELLKTLSDDQIALVGCAAALCVAGTIMSLSYYIGRGRIAAAGRRSGALPVSDSRATPLQPASAESPVPERRSAA